jgi:hypothetical protein
MRAVTLTQIEQYKDLEGVHRHSLLYLFRHSLQNFLGRSGFEQSSMGILQRFIAPVARWAGVSSRQ